MSVGVLIFFAVVGAAICAKARVPGGAVGFALVALVLFIGTLPLLRAAAEDSARRRSRSRAAGRGPPVDAAVSELATAVEMRRHQEIPAQ